MSAENKLQDIIQTSLESIRTVVDANTIIGDQIRTDSGTTIIPISKIAVGFASGGMDYNGKHAETSKNQNFGGGGGTGMSVTPVGFLIVDATGQVSMLNVGEGAAQKDTIGLIADVIERSPDIIARIKAFFGGKKKKKSDKADETEDTANGEETENGSETADGVDTEEADETKTAD